MKFEEVLPALRAGKKVRRAGWPNDKYIDAKDNNYTLTYYLYMADDWEIVPEPKRVATYLVRVVDAFFDMDLKKWQTVHIPKQYEVGTQPDGAVLIPNSEREVGE